MENLNQEVSGFAPGSSNGVASANRSHILFDMSKLGTFVSNEDSGDEDEVTSSEEKDDDYVMVETLEESGDTGYKPLVIEETDFPDYQDFYPTDYPCKALEKDDGNLISRD